VLIVLITHYSTRFAASSGAASTAHWNRAQTVALMQPSYESVEKPYYHLAPVICILQYPRIDKW
jgi:hypothetical protein